jgi:molybdopterin-synthase adenylyltransferase
MEAHAKMSTSLAAKSALVLGAGGLGGPALLVLATAGVGRLVIADDGVLEISDLSRQPLFGETDLDGRRSAAAARRLTRQFPLVRAEELNQPFDERSAVELVRSADVIWTARGAPRSTSSRAMPR